MLMDNLPRDNLMGLWRIKGPPQGILDADAEASFQKSFLISTFAEKLKEVLEGAWSFIPST